MAQRLWDHMVNLLQNKDFYFPGQLMTILLLFIDAMYMLCHNFLILKLEQGHTPSLMSMATFVLQGQS